MVEITQADIVDRLRTKYCCTTEDCNCDEAADTIERLRATIAALEQPTPELVEAAARGIVKRNFPNMPDIDVDEMWDGYAGDAKAALAAAAKHLGEG